MNLFPKPGKQYYIAAPPWETKSAGAKVLHLLCHALNISGQKAAIVPMGAIGVNHNLITPVAGKPDDLENCVAVYPEIVHGNPLEAKNVVRYLLFYPGVYGGPKEFDKTDMLWAYATAIADSAGIENVLTIPSVDSDLFKPDKNVKHRSGSCFYANKYRFVYNGQLTDVTKDSIEINQNMSQKQIIRLLQTSDVFYAYEDTMLILEAVLCGCPVVLLKGEYFPECSGLDDFGRNGVAWGNAPYEVKRAYDTIDFARDQYAKVQERFTNQLARFIEETQK